MSTRSNKDKEVEDYLDSWGQHPMCNYVVSFKYASIISNGGSSCEVASRVLD